MPLYRQQYLRPMSARAHAADATIMGENLKVTAVAAVMVRLDYEHLAKTIRTLRPRQLSFPEIQRRMQYFLT